MCPCSLAKLWVCRNTHPVLHGPCPCSTHDFETAPSISENPMLEVAWASYCLHGLRSVCRCLIWPLVVFAGLPCCAHDDRLKLYEAHVHVLLQQHAVVQRRGASSLSVTLVRSQMRKCTGRVPWATPRSALQSQMPYDPENPPGDIESGTVQATSISQSRQTMPESSRRGMTQAASSRGPGRPALHSHNRELATALVRKIRTQLVVSPCRAATPGQHARVGGALQGARLWLPG